MKKVILILIFVLIFAIALFFVIGNNSKDELSKDSENCIKVRTTYCPCSMGGEEICVLKSEVEEYENKLSNCSDNLLCLAEYNCKINDCSYTNGECVAI